MKKRTFLKAMGMTSVTGIASLVNANLQSITSVFSEKKATLDDFIEDSNMTSKEAFSQAVAWTYVHNAKLLVNPGNYELAPATARLLRHHGYAEVLKTNRLVLDSPISIEFQV